MALNARDPRRPSRGGRGRALRGSAIGFDRMLFTNKENHMITRPRTHLLVPLLALSLTLGMAETGHAKNHNPTGSSGTSASLRINFGSSPRWSNIRGTSVQRINQGYRTNYDMFRYGQNFYVYNNADDRWYMSRRYRGQFRMIDDRSVPWQIRRLSRENWRNYPTAWDNRDYRGWNGPYSTMQVNFGGRPRWMGVNGTRVEAVYGANRPSYDVFRLNGSYYAYNNDRWYTSSRESGEFTIIDEQSIPSEFSRVPRDQWRNYPSEWDGRDYQGSNGSNWSNGSYGTLTVSFGSAPRWTGISGTRVEEIYGQQRPGYDVFRYGGSYYAYNNDQWYTSSRESGQFTQIDEGSVPDEFFSIPRNHWRNYPSGWQDDNNNPRYNNSDRRSSRDRNDQWGSGRGGN